MRIAGWMAATLILVMASCSSPSQLVYSSGFSFANFDYVVVAKPDSGATTTSLYGMDVEFANSMTRNNMKVIGDKECEALPPERKARALHARIAITASRRFIILTIAFDEVVTGKTVASVTSKTKGDLLDPDERAQAFEWAAERLVLALENDRGTRVVDDESR